MLQVLNEVACPAGMYDVIFGVDKVPQYTLSADLRGCQNLDGGHKTQPLVG